MTTLTTEEKRMQNHVKMHSKVFIRGRIKVETGLHIGGNSVGLSIGGTDAVVVRNPFNNQPYIPGSSLRGKMRSLLERARGDEKDNPEEGGFSFNDKNDKKEALAGKEPASKLGKLFGVAAEVVNKTATRLIVRDAHLTQASLDKLKNAPNTDMPLTEVKTEVWIDRITSVANPRQIERVPAGAEFDFEMILTLLLSDRKEEFLNLIHEGMQLLQDDYLGGKGSRGGGKVTFKEVKLSEKTVAQYQEGTAATSLDAHLFAEFI
jgi:CRISPR-associated protein Csm3